MLGPPCPRQLVYLYEIFTSIAALRGYSQLGVNPIAWLDIMAWCWLHERRLHPWEIAVITQLDAVLLRIMSKKS